MATLAAIAVALAAVPAPEQIRLTHSALACDMNVFFATSNATAAGYTPYVRFGLAGGPLSTSVLGTSDAYVIFKIASPVLHFVPLTGLTCKTGYSYQVGDGQDSWSPVLSFTTGAISIALPPSRYTALTPPQPPLPPQATRRATRARTPIRTSCTQTWGSGEFEQCARVHARSANTPFSTCSNSANTATAVYNKVVAGEVSLIIHAGDIAYAGGVWPHLLLACTPKPLTASLPRPQTIAQS
jgi:hypothetical protein